ncbi:hypothetical protein [Nocardia wallacei]|uniref:hypothetical protein n=1 Tax=Nocardia wallacei TaxID=480035 RepID=UPI0024550E87|nr:hypothetical protein [Nocardia wallacei]
MTDKPNQTPESNEPPDKAAHETASHAATSPFDNPTGEFPPVRPESGKQVPRTDDELGLEPEVPAAGGGGAPPGGGSVVGGGLWGRGRGAPPRPLPGIAVDPPWFAVEPLSRMFRIA